jgi:hypothetical protein
MNELLEVAGLEQVAGDLAGDLLGVVAKLGGQVPVEPQGGQPVDQRPRGNARAQLVGARLGPAGKRAVQQPPRRLAGTRHLRVVGAVQLGVEHHLEVGPVGNGEADVGDADLQKAAGRRIGLPQPTRPGRAGALTMPVPMRDRFRPPDAR